MLATVSLACVTGIITCSWRKTWDFMTFSISERSAVSGVRPSCRRPSLSARETILGESTDSSSITAAW